MVWQRKLGGILALTGSLLLGVYIVPTVYGAAMSRLAIAQFREKSPANRDWNSARIVAYQRSLGVSFAPPEAILRVQRVGLEVPVLEGVDDLTLNRGAGHIPGTARPGQPGNIAIAGHRDGFFRILKDVIPGDTIDLERDGSVDRYRVRDISIVEKSDAAVLRPTADSVLTLVTCYPFHFVGAAPQRYIIRASPISTNTPSGD